MKNNKLLLCGRLLVGCLILIISVMIFTACKSNEIPFDEWSATEQAKYYLNELEKQSKREIKTISVSDDSSTVIIQKYNKEKLVYLYTETVKTNGDIISRRLYQNGKIFDLDWKTYSTNNSPEFWYNNTTLAPRYPFIDIYTYDKIADNHYTATISGFSYNIIIEDNFISEINIGVSKMYYSKDIGELIVINESEFIGY